MSSKSRRKTGIPFRRGLSLRRGRSILPDSLHHSRANTATGADFLLLSSESLPGGTMTSISTAGTEIAILSRLIRPEQNHLSVAAARALLKIDFEAQDRERMRELLKNAK